MAEVTFVIPCYQCRSTIGETLEAVFGQRGGFDLEVVVVDSGSDGAGEWVASRRPRCRVLTSSQRLTPGQARNRGAEGIRSRYLAFIDADAVPTPDWLLRLRQRLQQQPELELTGAAIANRNPRTASSRVLHWIEFSEFLPGLPARNRRALPSANWLLRRSAFERVGGFSGRLEMSEDTLFCRLLGGGIFFDSSTQIRHRQRQQWPQVRSHLRSLGYWSGHSRRGGLAGRRPVWLPVLVPLLVPWRAARILIRIARARPQELGRALLDLPRLLSGLAQWARGFKEGLQQERGQP